MLAGALDAIMAMRWTDDLTGLDAQLDCVLDGVRQNANRQTSYVTKISMGRLDQNRIIRI